jgi:tRNA (guanine6-N2)-methyltransferase
MTPDSRFAYRKADVPASLHPTLAAAAVRFIPIVATDSILDPFCGSGTLLAERAMRGPYRKLIGVDIEEKALNAARLNLESLVGVSLFQEDSSQLRLAQNVDVIISNPPYGQRVGSPTAAKRLHASLDVLASRVLRKDGIFVVFRPPHFTPPSGLKIDGVHRVDAGGIPIELIVARKP